MDLIIFQCANQNFVINSNSVREILDILPVTPVPFSPPYVDGLISATGDILLQIDLKRRLQLSQQDENQEKYKNGSLNHSNDLEDDDIEYTIQGHVLVIMSAKGVYGLKVDRVSEKITVNENEVLPVGRHSIVEALQNKHEIVGEINVNGSIFLLVDPEKLGLDDEISTFEEIEADVSLGSNLTLNQEDLHKDLSACLIVQTGHEYFAFQLEDVQEIVKIKLDQEITPLPHAPEEIFGLYLLRGVAIVAFSLADLFEIEHEHTEIFGIVVQTPSGRIMLCIEKMHGIHYYNKNDIQEPINCEAHFKGWIQGIHHEMVGIIDTKMVLNPKRLEEYDIYLLDNEETQQQIITEETQRFLSFWIGDEKCCLPLQNVQQVAERHIETNLPHPILDQIGMKTDKADDESLIKGVTQIQGIVMPIVDLYSAFHMGSFQNVSASDQGQYVIINCNEKPFALLVDRVDRVVDVFVNDIEQNINNMNKFISGIGRINGQLTAILSLMPLQEYDETVQIQKDSR